LISVNDMQRIEATTGSNAAPIDLSGISYPSGRQLGLSWVDGEVTRSRWAARR
jgi:hypothetical protein